MYRGERMTASMRRAKVAQDLIREARRADGQSREDLKQEALAAAAKIDSDHIRSMMVRRARRVGNKVFRRE